MNRVHVIPTMCGLWDVRERVRRRSRNVEGCRWRLDAVSPYWIKSTKSEIYKKIRKKELHLKINLRFDCNAVGPMQILTAHQLQHFQSIATQSPRMKENGKLNSGDKTNQATRMSFDDDRSTTCVTKRQRAKKKNRAHNIDETFQPYVDQCEFICSIHAMQMERPCNMHTNYIFQYKKETKEAEKTSPVKP